MLHARLPRCVFGCFVWGWFLAAAGLSLPGCTEAAEPPKLAALAPESTVVYLEVEQPEVWLDLATDARWPKLLEQTPQGRQFLASPELKQLKAGLSLIEQQLKTTWQQGLRDAIGGGLAVAVNPADNRSLIVARAKTGEVLPRLHQFVLDLDNLASLAGNRPARLTSEVHRGTTIWTFDQRGAYALLEDNQLLLLAQPKAALIDAIDRWHDGGKSLAGVPQFQQAQKLNSGGQTAWGMVRLDGLANLPQMAALHNAPRKNPGVESLLGGGFEALRRAPFVTLHARLADNRLTLGAQLPFDRSQLPREREWFFAPSGEGSAAALLTPPGTILSASSYRDYSGMWTHRDDLFDEATVAAMTQADASLGLFFAGRDFGSQVLGELKPTTRLVVANQTFAADAPTPAVKLPAFAAVLELKDSAKFAPALVAAYQTLVGIANLDGMQKGRPQLLQEMASHAGATVYEARYLLPPGQEQEKADIIYNFRPACAVWREHFIVASTGQLARQLVEELQKPAAAERLPDNTRVAVDVRQLAAALTDNQTALVTQNMLEKGNTRAEAEAEVGMLLNVLQWLRTGDARLTPGEQSLEFSASVELPRP